MGNIAYAGVGKFHNCFFPFSTLYCTFLSAAPESSVQTADDYQ
jgi:hypothetical protein